MFEQFTESMTHVLEFYSWLLTQFDHLADITINIRTLFPPEILTYYQTSSQKWLVGMLIPGQRKQAEPPSVDQGIKGIPLPAHYDEDARENIKAIQSIIYDRMHVGNKRKTQARGKVTAQFPESAEDSVFDRAGELLADIPKHLVCRHHGLAFLYRHAIDWRNGLLRSKLEESWALAGQCYYTWKVLMEYGTRILALPAGRVIHQELLAFASGFCLTNLAVQEGEGDILLRRFIGYDYDILDVLIEAGAEKNKSLLPVDITDRYEQLKGAECRSDVYSSLSKLVDFVRKMPTSRNGITDMAAKDGMPSFVAEKLDDLLHVSHFHTSKPKYPANSRFFVLV